MSRTVAPAPLTELEGAVLGVVIRDAPCTSYAVKELFRVSLSEQWSGSAGSIYPLMQRLERRRLVASKLGATGLRKRRVYRATGEGRRAFVRWLKDAERATGMGFDPLRTRLLFLRQLAPSELAQLRMAVLAELDRLAAAAPSGDPLLAEIHRVWVAARRQAFEEVVAGLESRSS